VQKNSILYDASIRTADVGEAGRVLPKFGLNPIGAEVGALDE
jgi:hypothetical protein